MQVPPVPPDEAARQADLDSLRILDTPAGPQLERLVHLASRLLEMPISLISLVDRDRQWFKAKVGLEASETPRSFAFCAHAVAAGQGLEVPDALADPRFSDNPLVTGDPHIRFYAGEVLHSPAGQPLGTLCVIDTKPRRLSEEDHALLKDLADLASQALWSHTAMQLKRDLLDHESQLSFLSEHSSDLLARHDPGGHFRFVSPSLRRLLGYEAGDILGKLPLEFVIPGDAETMTRAFKAAIRKAPPSPFQFRVRHKDGHPVWLESEMVAVEDPATGAVREVVVTSRDISVRVAMEENLTAREAFYRHMIENLDEGVVLQGPKGILQANSRACQILGLTEAQLRGRDSMDPRWRAVHEDGSPWPGETHPAMEVLATRQVVRDEVMGIHRPDGSLAWLHVNAIPVGTDEVVVSFSDITERFAAMGALRESEERYRGLVDALPDLLYRVARDGTYLDVAPGASLDPLAPAADMLGRNLRDFLPPGIADLIQAGLEEVLASGEPRTLQLHYDRGSGPRDYETRLSRCGPDECLLVVRDVSERTAADRMKREFVATVSHELRTPLSAIRGALGLLQGPPSAQLGDDAKEMLDIARRNTERLMRLINDILDLEGLESGQLQLSFRTQPLAALAREAVEAMRPLALQFDMPLTAEIAEVGQVRVDGPRLVQAIGNLLSNAVKFSPARTPVTLTVDRRDAWLRVEIQNGGPGIPEAFQPRIFGQFAQADASDTRARGGTGLGLSITKTLVERMGGRIGFESRPGMTRFFIEFPELR